MIETILISMPISELETVIINCVSACLKHYKPTNLQPAKEEDQFLDTEQAGKFLNLSIPTLYGLVHRKQIPVFKRGKQLRFSKELLTEWVKSGRKQTQAEIDLQSDLHLLKLKKGGN